MNTEFTNQLIREIVRNGKNYYCDNYDAERFGVRQTKQKSWLRCIQDHCLEKMNLPVMPCVVVPQLDFADFDFPGLEETYALLEDAASKKLLTMLFAYRILGEFRVKLPVNTLEYWSELSRVKGLANCKEELPIDFMGWRLSKFALDSYSYPLSMYSVAEGILNLFYLRQYEMLLPDAVFGVELGDVVIDAGGCWGDTALRFAHEAGEKGKVYSFEFVEANIKVFRQNLALNPLIAERVEIVQRPLWDISRVSMYCIDNGPGSCISFEPVANANYRVETITLDEWVAENELNKVDFIKMDIEGAELKALHGAESTLRKFRPKLAISVYHQLVDIVEIPRYLARLGLEYKFYLGHYTIHLEETVLYAIPAGSR